jgi:glycosyltransferase involved in cell wall biosynthesis
MTVKESMPAGTGVTGRAEPSLSVVIPVLNAERDLGECLASIYRQSTGAFEVIVADGGSSDATSRIAESFGARVVSNPYKLAEPGVAVGISFARGELVTVMAADNRMRSTDFIAQMIEAFTLPDVVAAFPRIVSTDQDGLATRYINRYSDPFSHFVYGDATSVQGGPGASDQYSTIQASVRNHPLLAIAQGCTVRRGSVYERAPGGADDVVGVLEIIRTGGKLVVVNGAELEHHTVTGLGDFHRKYRSRFRQLLTSRQGYRLRRAYLSRIRRARGWLWFPYSATLVLPAIHGALMALRRRDPLLGYHGVINAVLFAAFCRAFTDVARRSVSTRHVKDQTVAIVQSAQVQGENQPSSDPSS